MLITVLLNLFKISVSKSTYSSAALYAVNKIRSNPSAVASYVKTMVDSFQAPDYIIYTDMLGHRHRSHNGKQKFQEAYQFLKNYKGNLSALQQASCLKYAAQQLATSNDKTLTANYQTTSGDSFWNLMDNSCNHYWLYTQAAYDISLSYNTDRDGILQDIIMFIIGDGYESSNPNRDAIFSTKGQYFGADKQQLFPVMLVGGDRTKVSSNSLSQFSNRKRMHHK